MFFKRRWFKILTIALGLVLFVGYFAFSTLLFPLHEGRWPADVSGLVPRDVDFFAAKADLSRDFAGLPRLRVMDELEQTEPWRTFVASPEFARLDQEHGITATLERVRAQVAGLPLGIQPLGVFGGRDLALAGRFRGATIEEAEWAVYGRVNWIGKLGLALLAYPAVLGLSGRGISVSHDGGAFHLTGPGLAQPLWVTRVRDVAVISSSPTLVEGAIDLAARRGEGSLYLSSDYNDDIELAPRGEQHDELEVMFDVRALLSNLGHQGPLPDPGAEQFLPAFVGRIFQLPACKKVMGILGFRDGLSLDLHGTFSSEVITESQRRIYGAHGFSRDDVLKDIATIAPADSCLFVYLTGPVGVLLNEVLSSLEPALYSNLQDAFRSTGRYTLLSELVEDISDSLANRLALVVRANDYPPEVTVDPATGEDVLAGPPNDGAPVFSVALVAWHTNEAKLNELEDLVGWNPKVFGLEGKQGEAGYYNYRALGYQTKEFWSRFVPGTGIIASVKTNDLYYLTNNHLMINQLIGTRQRGGIATPRLSDDLAFRAMMRESLPGANVLFWLNPRTAAKTLREQARRWAEDNAARGVDWVTLRRGVERGVLQQMFAGRTVDQLTEEERGQLELAVDEDMRVQRNKIVRDATPTLAAEKERLVTYSTLVDKLLVCLALDLREFRLSVRAAIPLD